MSILTLNFILYKAIKNENYFKAFIDIADSIRKLQKIRKFKLIVTINDECISPSRKDGKDLCWTDVKNIINNYKQIVKSEEFIIYNCNDCNKEYVMHMDVDWTRCEECAKHYHDEDSECEECEDQDNFTNRMCENENCKKEFDVSEPHYYDEENGVCYCCEDCYCLCEKTTN